MCIDLPVQWRTPVILQIGRAAQYDDDMACNTTAYKKNNCKSLSLRLQNDLLKWC